MSRLPMGLHSAFYGFPDLYVSLVKCKADQLNYDYVSQE